MDLLDPRRLFGTQEPAEPRGRQRRPLRKRHRQLARLDLLLRACYPLIAVTTWEEQRLIEGIKASYGPKLALYRWTTTKGLVDMRSGECVDPATVAEPIAALRWIERNRATALYMLCDMHPWLAEDHPERTAVVRLLRDLYHEIRAQRDTGRSVLLVSSTLVLPSELEKEVVVYDFPLPDRETLSQLLERHEQGAAPGTVRLAPEEREKLLEAALGLTMDEADNAFTAAMISGGTLEASDIHTILAEKQMIIRKSGVLEYYPADEHLEDIGGLELLKAWLKKRARAFTREARDFGIPQPKGLLLTGVQGCGKSMSAKAIANAWHLPLLRLDVGKLFAGLVGQSEENLRKAIQLAEAIAPCVLWVDELEKGFAGMSGGTLDGGTTARVFSTFLTWMQEKQSSVFVVATANKIDGLPPELLRKGRFDEIFFVDLPQAQERRKIMEIHLKRRNRQPKAFDVPALVLACEGFSGAEIEQAIISALYEAFDAGTDLKTEHVMHAIEQTVPLYATMHEEVEAIRRWAHGRAVPASQAP